MLFFSSTVQRLNPDGRRIERYTISHDNTLPHLIVHQHMHSEDQIIGPSRLPFPILFQGRKRVPTFGNRGPVGLILLFGSSRGRVICTGSCTFLKRIEVAIPTTASNLMPVTLY